MKPAVILTLSAVTVGAALFLRRLQATGGRVASPFTFAMAADQGQGSDWPAGEVPAGNNEAQEEQNVQAFLAMIRAAEGTAKEGGYGALFGWPAAGRSFDPLGVSGHPKVFFNYTDKAGKTVRTSAAGAYQITWTTWAAYYVPFLGWCAVEGRECTNFTPATQDSFAVFLLELDGALEHVKAGRLGEALAIARGRWASLPGAGYDQPERTEQFVLNAYTKAGGTLA